jgi:hypothetical protein
LAAVDGLSTSARQVASGFVGRAPNVSIAIPRRPSRRITSRTSRDSSSRSLDVDERKIWNTDRRITLAHLAVVDEARGYGTRVGVIRRRAIERGDVQRHPGTSGGERSRD